MIKNYFFLSRLAFELKNLIVGATINDSFSYQKDTLEIILRNKNEFVLEFCVNHTLPFILIKETFSRKKKNSIDIFPQIINLKFSDVFIAKNDRVLLFLIENEISLFFTIRGKFTNLYLLSDENFFSFKKIPDEDLDKIKKEFLSLEYSHPLTQPDFQEEDNQLPFEELRRKYPFISSEIISREIQNSDDYLNEIKSEISKIFYDKFYIVNDVFSNDIKIYTTLSDNFDEDKVKEYSSALETTKNYIKILNQNEEFNNLFKLATKHIDKELTYLNKKRENLQKRIDEGSKEAYYRKIAELLLINKSKLEKGLNEICLQDIYSNEEISIQLNKKLNPQQNIEHYFDKAKDEKIFFDRVNKIIPELNNKISNLEISKSKLNDCKTLKDIQMIIKDVGIKMKNISQKPDEPKIKFKHYVIENRYNVYVGRDSKSNDLLTLKFAKQNDYWFHARSVSGSHVVLRIDNKNEAVPKSILKKVASIAAFHSKAKNSSLVPVSYTFKKYVIKKKGMDIGQVALLNEQTLLVKPEIPSDAVFIESEN